MSETLGAGDEGSMRGTEMTYNAGSETLRTGDEANTHTRHSTENGAACSATGMYKKTPPSGRVYISDHAESSDAKKNALLRHWVINHVKPVGEPPGVCDRLRPL